ncbi:MAG: hypothetical protein PF444_07140 [Bacteroidales bacterium]|jgi:hypothetical protein|nr:hypothetical protein [Bacteroidales bacterium]
MFFVGILSSIIPYIATIAAMCEYILVGQGSTVELDGFTENTDQAFTIEHSIKEHSRDQGSTLSYANFAYTFSTVDQETSPEYAQEPKLALLCPHINYQSLKSQANSNKAPPYFI